MYFTPECRVINLRRVLRSILSGPALVSKRQRGGLRLAGDRQPVASTCCRHPFPSYRSLSLFPSSPVSHLRSNPNNTYSPQSDFPLPPSPSLDPLIVLVFSNAIRLVALSRSPSTTARHRQASAVIHFAPLDRPFYTPDSPASRPPTSLSARLPFVDPDRLPVAMLV